MNLSQLTDRELINLYPALLDELKAREIVKTKNLVGEIGEHLLLERFANDPEKPTLARAPNSTRVVTAINKSNGDRYAVKVTTRSASGVFHSIDLNSKEQEFEYLVIVVMTNSLELKLVFELTWIQFIKYRRIKKPELKWYVPLSQTLRSDSAVTRY